MVIKELQVGHMPPVLMATRVKCTWSCASPVTGNPQVSHSLLEEVIRNDSKALAAESSHWEDEGPQEYRGIFRD